MEEVIHKSFYNINILILFYHPNLKNNPLYQKRKQNGLEASNLVTLSRSTLNTALLTMR